MSDTISKNATIRQLHKLTVSTNPDDFKANEKFISFMDDPEISSFGKWQWANGFNTALVAVEIAIAEEPSPQPDLSGYSDRLWRNALWRNAYERGKGDAQPEWIPCSERMPEEKKDVLIAFKHNMAVGFWEDILDNGEPVWYANCGDGWMTDTESVDGIPLAWIPLPNPYKGEEVERS